MADLSHLRRTPSRPRLGSKPFVGPAEQGDAGGDTAPARESGTSFGVRPFAPGVQVQPATSAKPRMMQNVAVADPPATASATNPEPASGGAQRPRQPESPLPEPAAEHMKATMWEPATVTPIEAPKAVPAQDPQGPAAVSPTSEREPDLAEDASGSTQEPSVAAHQAAEPEDAEAELDDVRFQLDDEFARLDARPWEEPTSRDHGFPEMEPLPAGEPSETASESVRNDLSGRDDQERLARVLESVAARIRSGALPLHGFATPPNDAAALATVLSALLGKSE